MINTTVIHQEYTLALPYWNKCRSCSEGEEAVHGAGILYLPKLGDQTDEDYEAYKLRARFFNAFAKTVSSHTGLVLRTAIVVEAPKAFEELEKNIDRTGSNVSGYIKQVLENVLTVGRHGTLIDYTQSEDGATLADTRDARPYWISYKAEDILDWAYLDGKLIYVLVREHLTKSDEFYMNTKQLTRFRKLTLDGGVYTQQIYVEGDNHSELLEVTDPIIPQKNGTPLDYIPFVIHQSDFSIHVDKPPLLDLANTCLAHYRVSADYYHGLHFVALPTPYLTGVDPEDPSNPSSIGPQKMWLLENENTQVGLLEFTGAGLDALRDALSDLKDDMALLGARMLMNERTEQTATAAKIKSISETSDLSALVTVLNVQFDELLKETVDWSGFDLGEVSVTISKAFIPPDLDASMLVALVKGWQEGAYDYRTLVNNLKSGEIVDPHEDVDALENAVEQEMNDRFAKESVGLASTSNIDFTKAE